MVRRRGGVGYYLPSILVQWYLVIVLRPDVAEFPHDPLAGQIIEVALPTLVGGFLIAFCWRLLQVNEAEASRASAASLFGVAGFLGLLALGPTVSGRFEWWMALNVVLAIYLTGLGVRELGRYLRIRDRV